MSESPGLALFETIPLGIVYWNAQGAMTAANPAAQRLLGLSFDEMRGRTAADPRWQAIGEDGTAFPGERQPSVVALATGEAVRDVIIGVFNPSLKETRWFQTDAIPQRLPGEARPYQVYTIFQDITERKQREAEREQSFRVAQERADCDPLTGLFNHRAFHKRLGEETARAQREGTILAVVMLDMDNFKYFNDTYGHPTGDRVLKTVAERLQAICRPYDTLARFGGDEFALLLPGVGPTTLREIEARLRRDLDGLFYRSEEQNLVIPITVSVGVSLYPRHSLDAHEVLRLADERLMRSKAGAEGEREAGQMRLSLQERVEGFSMLDALVMAVDTKDRYTRKHSEDVMAYSLMIAGELGLAEATLYTIATAALLHDVGKVGVPPAILRKPGKLTDAEFAALRQHPVMGAAIVGAVPGLEDTLDAVRYHHERWDGQGYPAGLKGDETPLLARLMAVADAFSAMTTDHPYRKGLSEAKALSILLAGAGTQWDRACVEALQKALRAAA